MRVGIISDLVPFTERFSTALENIGESRYQILTFRDENQAKTAAENGQIDVLLCDARLYRFSPTILSCPLIILVEKKADERTEGAVSYLCRYKNIREWDRLLQEHAKKSVPTQKKTRESRIVLFTSGSGGTGTSTAAAAFSMYCAKQKWKPVYLNFEPINSTEFFFHGDELFGMDECLSCLRDQRFDFHSLMKKALIKDISGVRFFKPCRVVQDTLSITGEEIVELCGKLQEEPQVGMVIIDMPVDASMNIVLPLLTSWKTVLVSNGESIANQKTEQLLKMIPSITNMSPIEVQEKTLLLYNRYRQDTGQVLKEVSIGKLGGINLRREHEPEILAEELSKLEPFQRLGEQLYV